MKRDYIEFQERSFAKAYLITFRCYGTWLHGDERGSVDRRYYNRVGRAKITHDPEKVVRKAALMKGTPFTLGAVERKIVGDAISEVCGTRGYVLFALNVRTNHAHVVVSNSGEPERMMDSFKAYCTKALRLSGRIGKDAKPWSRHGSTRYLWTEEHISQAIEYVVNGQGGEIPTFE
jgi:hypothetical protein